MCEFNTKIAIVYLLRLTIVSASQKFTVLDEVIYHQVIPLLWKQKLPYYSSASQNSCRVLGHLLKFKHASNRPVYFHVSPSYFPVRLLHEMRI